MVEIAYEAIIRLYSVQKQAFDPPVPDQWMNFDREFFTKVYQELLD